MILNKDLEKNLKLHRNVQNINDLRFYDVNLKFFSKENKIVYYYKFMNILEFKFELIIFENFEKNWLAYFDNFICEAITYSIFNKKSFSFKLKLSNKNDYKLFVKKYYELRSYFNKNNFEVLVSFLFNNPKISLTLLKNISESTIKYSKEDLENSFWIFGEKNNCIKDLDDSNFMFRLKLFRIFCMNEKIEDFDLKRDYDLNETLRKVLNKDFNKLSSEKDKKSVKNYLSKCYDTEIIDFLLNLSKEKLSRNNFLKRLEFKFIPNYCLPLIELIYSENFEEKFLYYKSETNKLIRSSFSKLLKKSENYKDVYNELIFYRMYAFCQAFVYNEETYECLKNNISNIWNMYNKVTHLSKDFSFNEVDSWVLRSLYKNLGEEKTFSLFFKVLQEENFKNNNLGYVKNNYILELIKYLSYYKKVQIPFEVYKELNVYNEK